MAQRRLRRAVLAAAITITGSVVGLPQVANAASAQAIAPQPPPTVMPLGMSFGGSMVVDETNQHVFISGNAAVVVTDFDGNVVKTITFDHDTRGLTIDGDTNSLYVALHSGNSIAQVDLTSLTETKRYTLGTFGNGVFNICPEDVAADGETLWFTQACGSGDEQAFTLNLSDGTVTTFQSMQWANRIVTVPGEPHRFVMYDDNSSGAVFHLVDASTPAAQVIADSTDVGFKSAAAAVSGDGAHLYSGGKRYSMTDLSSEGTYTGLPSETTIATTDGFVAVGDAYTNSTTADLQIFGGDFASAGRSFVVPGGVPSGGLAWASGDRLFAISPSSGGSGAGLVIINDANLNPSALTVSSPKKADSGQTLTVTGTLASALGTAQQLSVSRKSRLGTFDLAPVTTAADGTFSFTDQPGATGDVTYTVTFAGTATTAGSTGQSTTHVQPFNYDFNGDGFADLAVGTPFEDVGSVTNAGQVHVLYSHASGVTGSGSIAFTQDDPGVPGVVEAGDQFGWSQASGDFNGDGFADLAVSSNAEDVGSVSNAGTVTVFYGSASGITTAHTQLIQLSPADKNGYFGEAMAVGDFNGDGMQDLAIGEAGHGFAYAYFGSPTGLNLDVDVRDMFESQDFPTKVVEHDSLFGFALAAGDINGDGYDDLAFGAPWDYHDHGYSAGAVYIAYGGRLELKASTGQRITKDTSGVPGAEHPFTTDAPDDFGWQLGLADYNGDGKADLLVGAPGSPVWTKADNVKHEDAGTITVLYSDGSKIGTTNAAQVSQDTTGVPGAPAKYDYLGQTIATGDVNGDGKADAVFYSPGDHYVTLVIGSSTGLQFAHASAWTQNSSSIPGSDEAGDNWGDSLRFENFKGAGPQGLAVGADGENNGAGAVTVIYSTTSGLTGTGSQYFDQNSPGISGVAEAGDGFGCFF